jgi:hypothetical protein
MSLGEWNIWPTKKALTQEREEDTNVGLGFIGLAYQGKKDIVFRFIIEYIVA